jgi:hypothetical protein
MKTVFWDVAPCSLIELDCLWFYQTTRRNIPDINFRRYENLKFNLHEVVTTKSKAVPLHAMVALGGGGV